LLSQNITKTSQNNIKRNTMAYQQVISQNTDNIP